jgi:hypothetical protein
MYLPNKEKANVAIDKISNYLLSTSHPVGKYKAAFFESIGFEINQPEILQEALRRIPEKYVVKETASTQFGKKFIIDGNIVAPNHRSYLLRTVWIVKNNADTAYLVTAYPL